MFYFTKLISSHLIYNYFRSSTNLKTLLNNKELLSLLLEISISVTKMKIYLSRNRILKTENLFKKKTHYRNSFEDIYKYVKGSTNRSIFLYWKPGGWEETSIYSVPHRMHSLTIVRVDMILRNSSEKVSD